MAAKKKSARKKTAAKKKVAVKKKTATAKKATAGKKTARKAASKKTAAKKTAGKKKVAAKKKTASKKVATKKKATASKKKAASSKSGASASKNKKATATPATSKKAAAKPAAKKTKASKQTMPKAGTSATRKRQRTPEEVRPGFTPYKEKKGEEYMNAAQTEHFRKLLLEWKQELMEEVDRTVHHMQDEVANYPDPNDRATVEEEFALELRTRDRERKLIKKINESLVALDAGDYGYCEVCGIEIGVKRLEARPTATLCIDCKTLDEIKERQYG